MTLDIYQWRSALQSIVNCENRSAAYDAVHSWIAFDVENRGGYMFDLSNIVKSAATKRPQGKPTRDVVSCAAFDPLYCGTQSTLSDNNKRIKKKECKNGDWNRSAMGAAPCKEFSIRLIGNWHIEWLDWHQQPAHST